MSSVFKTMLTWVMFLSLLKVSHSEENASDEDEHMCNKTIKYEVEKEVKYNYTYKEPTPLCNIFSFFCREKTRTEKKKIIEYKNKNVYGCCEGYEKLIDTCIPVCTNECINGNCTAPETCSCEEGWTGIDCFDECEEGNYGKNCMHTCMCKNGATCDKINGSCLCTPGFTGEYCESPCPKDSFGNDCENSCNCKNGAACNKTNGTCECKAGYYGKQCKYKCVVGTFGAECKDICKCKMENTDVCNHIDGKCFCKHGWRGKHCEKSCKDNTWGPSCLFKCECGINGNCDRITGDCYCPPGWDGPNCEQKCPVGYFSNGCKMKCPDCLHEPGTCHHETGWCNCPLGSTGPTCDLECPKGTYGKKCESICLCSNNSICDAVSGKCICFPGWIGDECQFPCPEGTYGKNCSSSCHCPDKLSCNRFDGTCNCSDTDDDPLCNGPLLLKYEESNKYFLTIAILVLIIIICIILLLVCLAIFLIRRKPVTCDTFSLCKSFRSFLLRRKLKSSNSDEVNDAKNFNNPVYEVMDDSLRPTHCAHSFDNPLATTNDELDFKIPECDINTDEKNLESSRHSSPVYTEVDLQEHHFEFPSRVMN